MDVTWPLVGRQAELEVLSAVLADTRAGGVVLVGEAGIGKTRMAQEALARAETAGGGRWLAATRAALDPVRGRLLPAAPSERLGDGHLDTLRRTAELLAERSRGQPLLLGVDDAHLLDDASAHWCTSSRSGASPWWRHRGTGEPAPTR